MLMENKCPTCGNKGININSKVFELVKMLKELDELGEEHRKARSKFSEFGGNKLLNHCEDLNRKWSSHYDKLCKFYDDNGIEFSCGDYGDAYCLDEDGLEHVLKFIFKKE